LFVNQQISGQISEKNELSWHRRRGIKPKEIKILANGITKRREIY
jgi:hypothetical protein